MRNLLDRILRSPDDGGAGGGASGGDGGAGAAGAAAGAGGAADANAGAGDGGAGAGEGGAAAGGYRPEGMPDDFYGASDKDTIDKLFQAQQERLAGIPEDPKEYGQFAEVSDELKPYFQSVENDGMFDDISTVAKEHGVPKAAFQAIVGKYMEKAAELGLLEPPLDKAAERAELLPDAAKNLPQAGQTQAIERRMNDNIGFIGQMVQRGMPQDVADHAIMMLGDSAKGHKAIEFFRAQMSGANNPNPAGANNGGGASDPKAELTRRAALPENTPGHAKFDRKSYDALEADYRRIHGD